MLSQTDSDGHEYMVMCCSRSLNYLNKHENKYSSYKGECLAAVWGSCRKIYRHFLHGCWFILVTDHEPLKWLKGSARLEGAHARWACMLQEYDFEIIHMAGALNANANALSRMPLPSTRDVTGARLDHDYEVQSAIFAQCPMAYTTFHTWETSRGPELLLPHQTIHQAAADVGGAHGQERHHSV